MQASISRHHLPPNDTPAQDITTYGFFLQFSHNDVDFSATKNPTQNFFRFYETPSVTRVSPSQASFGGGTMLTVFAAAPAEFIRYIRLGDVAVPCTGAAVSAVCAAPSLSVSSRSSPGTCRSRHR
mmetsp:Transcript_40042/g.93889  ORF Transcript_40042/g.93889 Transcript_40042/m.93889 type:complete len:125 (+) Transcript_40042:607-981(+)